MGRLISGINGPIRGKVGTVIGSSWKGIPYLKGLYKKRTKRISKNEKANRNKFSMAQYWLKPLLPFVRQGFKGYSLLSEGFTAAKSYLLKNAVETSPSGIMINPALMKVSFGDLPLPAGLTVEKIAGNRLQFSWDPTKIGDINPRDQVMLLAYDIKNANAHFTINGQFRSSGSDSLEIDGSKGKTYHVYMAFSAADRSRQSDSVYMGTVKY